MRRQHLAVRIDVDAGPLGRFEDRREIAEVVAGNQDRLAGDRRDAHLGRRRHAEGPGVAGVERLHGGEIAPPKRQRFLEHRAEVGFVAGQHVERLGDARGDRLARFAEILGMMRVGGDALQSVKQQRAQADDVLAEPLDAFAHAERLRPAPAIRRASPPARTAPRRAASRARVRPPAPPVRRPRASGRASPRPRRSGRESDRGRSSRWSAWRTAR